MTSLKIAFPDIPYNAKIITPGSPTDPDQGERNLISGKRHRGFQFADDDTTGELVFDLGAGNERTAEYVIVARADRLVRNGLERFQLANSSDDSSYSDCVDATDFSTLYGPHAGDFLLAFSATSAERYWRATYTSADAQAFWHSKLYFGSFFDFGKDPGDVRFERVTPERSAFISDSGSQWSERGEDPRYRFIFTWGGIADEKIASFASLIGARRHSENGVFLYAATETQVLDGHSLMHCEIESAESRKLWDGWNEIRVSFLEMRG